MKTKLDHIPEKGFFADMEDGRHDYYYDRKKMTGCTTVLSVISKPALIAWSANCAVDSARKGYLELLRGLSDRRIDTLDEYIVFETDKVLEILEEARTAYAKKRDDAASKGTDVHAEIEWMIKESILNRDGLLSPSWLKGDESEQYVHFYNWAIKNKVRFLASEKPVYSKTLWVAGTYDFKCEIDGKVYLGDIKTSSGIYDRVPFAQCAAYQMMEEEMFGEPNEDSSHKHYLRPTGRLVINLKKTGKFDEEKDVYFSYDYEQDLKIFKAALDIYRFNKKMVVRQH